jgi:hypothetical protein
MTVIVKHNKTNSITDWTQAQLNEQIALGNFPSGTTLANIVLPSDWNNDHTLTGLGTMAEQNANSVAITGGTINNTTIGASTASTGRFTTLDATGQVNFNSSSATSTFLTRLNTNGQTSGYCEYAVTDGSRFSEFGLAVTSTSSYGDTNEVYFRGSGQTVGTVISSASATTPRVRFITGASGSSSEQFRVANTASAVNYVQVTGAATSANPVISAQGSDATVNLSFQRKGNGNFQFLGPVILGSNAVNYWQTSGATTTLTPQLQVLGSDTNISMAFQPKGTGAIDLAAGSKGVNISNGGTVTAITRTASGGSYTSIPSVALSAPTTAGGVQATASAALFIQTVTIAGGGTGYTVGNTLTVVGGTSGAAATLTVSTVSSGVITGVTVATGGTSYTVLPTNPFSVTGGSGSGATFNATAWGVSATITITNAGSGYIEQPTITFSGGGGSGAAAYATVGSTPIVKSLTTALDFNGANGKNFSITDHPASGGGTAVNFVRAFGSQTGYTVGVMAQGTDANTPMLISSRGTGTIGFWTNSVSQQQFVVSHTASAVNYVQVTGSATGVRPLISVQGSDTNIPLNITGKGTGGILFTGGGASYTLFNISGASSAANHLQVATATTGNAPVLSSQGSDTNIDLALTPKGTGNVRFGTYTASMALTVQGYIEIKDSGGTIRKLAVIA